VSNALSRRLLAQWKASLASDFTRAVNAAFKDHDDIEAGSEAKDKMMSRIRCALALAVALLLTISPGHVQDQQLLPPKEAPILSIEGNIRVTNADGVAQFDRGMLEKLGMTTLTTTTPWFSGPVEFEGVLLKQIMALVGAQGTEVVAIALNDYRTTIPLKDFDDFDVILALKRDKQYMPVSDKGPLFVVYPYDSVPELHAQKYYARSIWQLTRLIVR
jgi:hypothetical protein